MSVLDLRSVTADEAIDAMLTVEGLRVRAASLHASTDLLTAADVAELAGVKVETIRMYTHRGTIPPPTRRIGQSPVWKRRTIETWIATRRTAKGKP